MHREIEVLSLCEVVPFFFYYYFSCSRFCFSKLWPPPPAKGSDRPSLGPSFSFFFYLWNEFAVHFCGNFPPACPLCVGVSVSRSWSCSSAKKNHINIKRLLWLLVVLVCRWGGVGKKSPMLRVRECIYIYITPAVWLMREARWTSMINWKRGWKVFGCCFFFFTSGGYTKRKENVTWGIWKCQAPHQVDFLIYFWLWSVVACVRSRPSSYIDSTGRPMPAMDLYGHYIGGTHLRSAARKTTTTTTTTTTTCVCVNREKEMAKRK